jgi:hypothetical protein
MFAKIAYDYQEFRWIGVLLSYIIWPAFVVYVTISIVRNVISRGVSINIIVSLFVSSFFVILPIDLARAIGLYIPSPYFGM